MFLHIIITKRSLASLLVVSLAASVLATTAAPAFPLDLHLDAVGVDRLKGVWVLLLKFVEHLGTVLGLEKGN